MRKRLNNKFVAAAMLVLATGVAVRAQEFPWPANCANAFYTQITQVEANYTACKQRVLDALSNCQTEVTWECVEILGWAWVQWKIGLSDYPDVYAGCDAAWVGDSADAYNTFLWCMAGF